MVHRLFLLDVPHVGSATLVSYSDVDQAEVYFAVVLFCCVSCDAERKNAATASGEQVCSCVCLCVSVYIWVHVSEEGSHGACLMSVP